jgi:hypothetical protein
VLPASLGGCAITPLTIASYSFDGFSYAASGKSLTDHAISEVMDQDCGTLRVFRGEWICRDYTPEQRKKIELARAETPKGDRRTLHVAEPDTEALSTGAHETALADAHSTAAKTRELQTETTVAPTHHATVPALAMLPPQRPRNDGRDESYLVLASFSGLPSAERALATYKAANPSLVSAVVDGKPMLRVVSGPYAAGDLAKARSSIAKSYGIRDSWTLPACPAAHGADCRVPKGSDIQVAALPGAQ